MISRPAACPARSIIRRKPDTLKRRPALAHEHERVFAALSLKFAQRPEFSPRKRMRRRRAILDPTNVQDRLIKVGLLPTKIDKLGRAEPVPESDQDHRRVTVAPPIALGRLDEALDLCRRQVLAGPQLSVRWTPGRTALRHCALFRFWAD